MISFRFKADHILNQKYGAQETPLLHRRNIITGPDLCIVQNLFFFWFCSCRQECLFLSPPSPCLPLKPSRLGELPAREGFSALQAVSLYSTFVKRFVTFSRAGNPCLLCPAGWGFFLCGGGGCVPLKGSKSRKPCPPDGVLSGKVPHERRF